MRSADITVVMETNYTTYVQNRLANDLAALTVDKDSLCVLLHSVPPDLPNTKFLVDQLRSVAHHLWVSDSSVDYYNVTESYVNGRFEELVISEIESPIGEQPHPAHLVNGTVETEPNTFAIRESGSIHGSETSTNSSQWRRRKRRWWRCGF